MEEKQAFNSRIIIIENLQRINTDRLKIVDKYKLLIDLATYLKHEKHQWISAKVLDNFNH